MNSKQYLKQAYRLNELIETDREELTKLRSLSTSISSQVLSDEPRAGTRDTNAKFVKIIEQIEELDLKIQSELSYYLSLKSDIRDKINKVVNFNQRLLLKYRYIDFLSWEDIALKMSYGVTQTHRIHSEALRNIKMV